MKRNFTHDIIKVSELVEFFRIDITIVKDKYNHEKLLSHLQYLSIPLFYYQDEYFTYQDGKTKEALLDYLRRLCF